MAGRGPAPGQDQGRGRGRGGRGTPGRGGRSGGFGQSSTPPPPFARGGRAGVGYAGPGRGRGSPAYAAGPAGRGAGGRGRGGAFTPSPQGQPAFRRTASAGRGGRSFAGGSPGTSQGSVTALQTGGVGGGKLFGRGAEAVAFDRDKEKGLWKVGPPAGQRFSAAWLQGLSNFVAWKLQQAGQQAGQQGQAPRQQQQQEQQQGQQQQPSSEAVQAQPGTDSPLSTPPRPRVTVERLPGSADSGGEQQWEEQQQPASSGSSAGTHASWEAGVAGEAVLGGAEASGETADWEGESPLQQQEEEQEEGQQQQDLRQQLVEEEGEEEVGVEEAGEGEEAAGELSPAASSASSDLGWAGVLGAVAAGEKVATTDESVQGSPVGQAEEEAEEGAGVVGAAAAASGSGALDAAAGSDAAAAGDGSSRHWWPASEASLAGAQPVPVERCPAPSAGGRVRTAGGGGGDGRVQLSIRLERQGLTDREAGMLADWCEQQRAAADVRKLWLFDNRLGDAGALAVARILAAHPGMQEIHLSHNLLGLQGASALLAALPVAPPSPEARGSGSRQQPADAPQEGSQSAAAGKLQLAAAAAAVPGRPCWLRLEWNRISVDGLIQVLEAQHTQRGLVVDLPAAVRADATPSLPRLPPYLSAAAAASPATPTPVPASRGGRNTLQYQVEACHARLPWISCQYQLPAEAEVLRAARAGWHQQQQQAVPIAAPPPPPPPRRQAAQPASPSLSGGIPGASEPAASAAAPASPATAAAAAPAPAAAPGGPLLLFPDTSALLPMLGAGPGVSIPTFFTLDLLGGLAQQGRFGRGLPPGEQVFVVVTDSVSKQLDGMKNDPAARPAVRRFLGQSLDAYGPAGADFLSVLGAHEGEGLIVEHDATVTGSSSGDVGTKGQRTDHRIVEVALFFQKEILRSSAGGSSGSQSAAAGGPAAGAAAADQQAPSDSSADAGAPGSPVPPVSPAATPAATPAAALSAASFPVLLLSGDNAQVQTARSHGLPAVRMSDVAAARSQVEAELAREGRPTLSASLLRAALGAAATTGLGTTAGRSLQAEFDEAVALLAATADALAASQERLEIAAAAGAAPGDPAAALAAVQQVLAGPAGGGSEQGGSGGPLSAGQLLPALRARLAEWQARVRSHQDPSRLLRWASGASSSTKLA